MKKSLIRFRAARSVVELLIWVILAGFLVANIIPNVQTILHNVRKENDIHNARTLVKIFEKARVTGLSLEGDTKDETIDRVVTGGWATTGPLAGTFFGIPEMSEMEKLGAASYLEFDHGTLRLREGSAEK